jgi:hypothetical protein
MQDPSKPAKRIQIQSFSLGLLSCGFYLCFNIDNEPRLRYTF